MTIVMTFHVPVPPGGMVKALVIQHEPPPPSQVHAWGSILLSGPDKCCGRWSNPWIHDCARACFVQPFNSSFHPTSRPLAQAELDATAAAVGCPLTVNRRAFFSNPADVPGRVATAANRFHW